jgi:alkanesulfonate monooxygenase SsuD/methylene tetrahydromethanopterin reductase-like flavin-dependent oxidoreductase (luciferase family)
MLMKVGVSLFFQNYLDWDRYTRGAWDEPPEVSDSLIYDEELGLGDLVEPLGFDSLWTVEHHHTPYTMIPNPTQLLSYYAGRTNRIDMGTMVMVLPWHHPIHLAENIALLDNLLQGRHLYIGVGRGASSKEYGPLGLSMEESRQYFLESQEIVRKALTTRRFSYAGKIWNVNDTSLRPTPRTADITQRMYSAWGSPQTLPIVAQAGLGILIIPMKPWVQYIPEITDYHAIREANDFEPLAPIAVCWVYCHEDPEEARIGALAYMGNYWDSSARHYGFASVEEFKGLKSYEHYQNLAEAHANTDGDPNAKFAETQVYGTPDQCIERLKEIQRTVGVDHFVGVFRYGGMPVEKAESSMRLFADAVLPVMHEYEPRTSSSRA